MPAVRLLRVVAMVGVLLVGGCGSDPPADYSDENRTNVLAACASDTDRPIVADVCACTYRSIRTRLPYERFAEIDAELGGRPGAALPPDVLELMAECIIEVGEL